MANLKVLILKSLIYLRLHNNVQKYTENQRIRIVLWNCLIIVLWEFPKEFDCLLIVLWKTPSETQTFSKSALTDHAGPENPVLY